MKIDPQISQIHAEGAGQTESPAVVPYQQLELATVIAEPAERPEGLEALLAALADGEWHLTRDLVPVLGLRDDRAMRLLVEAAKGEIMGSNKGLALTRARATTGEAEESGDRMISDGKKVIKRGFQIKRIAAAEMIARTFPRATARTHSDC